MTTTVDQTPESVTRQEGRGVAVSVIIPARNEEQFLAECLESLRRLDFPRESFEVILVDNGSTDRTLEIAARFKPSLDLRILQKAGVPISALRNLGAAAARGDVFAFLDADCRVPPSWLRDATALLCTQGVGVIGAEPLLPENATWVCRAWLGRRTVEKRGEVNYVGTANFIVSRENFLRVSGFDESLETNEDCEFCHRIRAAGLSVLAFPQIAIVHLRVPRTLADFYRKQKWHGTHVFKVFLREISALANARAILFALYTLLCLAGIVAGGLFALATNRFGLLTAAVAAMLLPSVFLAAQAAVARKSWMNWWPLTLLYLTYGFARAVCILNVRAWLTAFRPPGVPEARGSARAKTPAP
jgi:glycosyltransferase involved in cell wall biosynthesis